MRASSALSVRRGPTRHADAADRARDVDLAAPDATVVLVREHTRDVEAGADDEAVYAGLVDLSTIVNKVRSSAARCD